ncbi:MAG: hypothetical protein KAI34_04170 [Candidatus Lokiarchaeota archaeon]|nr:hypothetical protein [Candidatus Lokiarchaeota archaeon]
MQDVQQTIRYSDLCRELKDFVQGNTTLSTVKDFLSVFWNSAHSNQKIDDETIAKVEILKIGIEAYENGDFAIDDLQQILQDLTAS